MSLQVSAINHPSLLLSSSELLGTKGWFGDSRETKLQEADETGVEEFILQSKIQEKINFTYSHSSKTGLQLNWSQNKLLARDGGQGRRKQAAADGDDVDSISILIAQGLPKTNPSVCSLKQTTSHPTFPFVHLSVLHCF